MKLLYSGNPVRSKAREVFPQAPAIQATMQPSQKSTTTNMGMFMRVAPPPPGTSCGCGGAH